MVVGVVEADEAVGIEQTALTGKWAALQIAGQIKGHAAAVGVRGIDLHVPVLAIQVAEACAPMRQGLLRRQGQVMGVQQLAQAGQELAGEQPTKRHQGQQEAAPGGAPRLIGGQAPGADQGVYMRMTRQRAAPGVQRHEDAGHGAQVTRVGEQLQQRQAHGVEEQLGQGGAVEAPQRQQFMRQGEDDVEMRARQQTLQLGIDPMLARGVTATRATAVVAGVQLKLFEAAGGAAQDMAAASGGVAVADTPGGAGLARMQRVLRGIVVEVGVEDLLQ